MAAVVFMRGVNVGGHRAFRPAAMARELSDFDVVNIGAAGTFVVRKRISQARLREELRRRLPFEAELMIRRDREVSELASAAPFPRTGRSSGARRFVSVLAKRPRTIPPLPLSYPERRGWQVRIVGLHGRFALSLWRKTAKTMVYPNEVVERQLRIPATTRTWETISKIDRVLRRQE